jgi:HlyD family secretion protein
MKAKWIGLVLLIAAGVIGALWGTGQINLNAVAGLQKTFERSTNKAVTPQPPAVSVMRPANRKFIETLRVNGSLVAREEVLVAPQIESQRITELHVEAGDRVRHGQLLARLATENLDTLVAQIDATIQRTEAGMGRAKSSIIRAEAQLKEAAAALKRAKPLSRSGYLADSVLDQRQANATAAGATLAIARGDLNLVASEKAEAEAKRREILWRRSRAEIRSPVAGLILSRSAKIGAIATAIGEPMFRIAKAGEIELEGEVTSEQLHRIVPGQTVKIELAGRPSVSATVRMVNPRVDLETRLGHVRIFIGQATGLRIGTYATGIIETATAQGLAVPASSIMRDANGPYVQIVRKNKVRVRRLTTGLISAGYVQVRTGLSKDD